MDAVHVHIDLLALQANYFRRLQHLLDIITVLRVGCENVTAHQIAQRIDFGHFTPANGAQLGHKEAQSEAQDWLLRGFLRDAIEGTGVFLDECLHICEVMYISAYQSANGSNLSRLFNEVPLRNQKLHFPLKLDKLKRQFGISTRFNQNVLSINKARTCVVHRLGLVSSLDIDSTGTLNILFQHAKFVARGQETGQEYVIDRPGVVTIEDSVLEVHFINKKRSFKQGELIRLQSGELYDTVITLWRFGLALSESIEAYGKSIGIQQRQNAQT